MLADLGVGGIVEKIVTDIEIEIAIAVQIGERGRSRPVAIAAQAYSGCDVLERSVAFVAIERVRMPAGDEEVGPAVIVIVGDGDSMAI